MRVQLCQFLRTERSIKLEFGVAFLANFDVPVVDFIVDQSGRKLAHNEVWDFRLVQKRGYGYISTIDD